MQEKKTVVIVGAGPAGLTAAYELATRSEDYHLVVVEADEQVGGISRTVDYKGNKIDIGGHRFFSKSEKVLAWWQQFLPIYTEADTATTTYHQQTNTFTIHRKARADEPHMLLRPRKSRIYYQRRFFEYPLKLSPKTLWNIGLVKSLKIAATLLYRRVQPRRPENNLEDFYINRFGDELYATFFKDYTHKVWGKPCREISAEWGRQRVKGLGLRTIIGHYLTSLLFPQRQTFGNAQTVQTLTEYFLYPQKGPGQLWEAVADACVARGVELRLGERATQLHTQGQAITGVTLSTREGKTYHQPCHALFSTMPIRHLVRGLGEVVPETVRQVALRLQYRDFIMVGLLLDRLPLTEQVADLQDNWLYIQDTGVQVGRLQFFNNWSPHMVARPDQYWIGAEYFCEKGDALWELSDEELQALAARELEKIGVIHAADVLDGTVVRMPKAYPSYVGTYQHFGQVRRYLDGFPNLFLMGRNGTHRYNNQDHSMLTAMEAVKSFLHHHADKSAIWEVNTEPDYHEEVKT